VPSSFPKRRNLDAIHKFAADRWLRWLNGNVTQTLTSLDRSTPDQVYFACYVVSKLQRHRCPTFGALRFRTRRGQTGRYIFIYIDVEESRPPLWSSGQSSWLQNGDVLCFLWGKNWIYICYVEESRLPLWSSGQSSWLQIQRSRVRFPAQPDFLRSTQPCEYNWGPTWKKKYLLRSRKSRIRCRDLSCCLPNTLSPQKLTN
jgi:hypothetical protein